MFLNQPGTPPQDIDVLNQAYIGLVAQFFHQQPGRQPSVISCRFQRWLDSAEQPYERRLKLTEEWQAFPVAEWLDAGNIGMVVVKNDEGHYQSAPTPEQKLEVDSHIVQIAQRGRLDDFPVPIARVRPGECCQFEPEDLSKLVLRCCNNEARVTVLITPR